MPRAHLRTRLLGACLFAALPAVATTAPGATGLTAPAAPAASAQHESAAGGKGLTTVAERSGFLRTGRYAEVIALCDAIAAHPNARFYAAVAAFTRAFASVEVQGFDMLE